MTAPQWVARQASGQRSSPKCQRDVRYAVAWYQARTSPSGPVAVIRYEAMRAERDTSTAYATPGSPTGAAEAWCTLTSSATQTRPYELQATSNAESATV